CLPSILWLLCELRARRLKSLGPDAGAALSVHNLTALWSLLIMGFIVSLDLISDALSIGTVPHSLWLARLALAALVSLMISCLWDERAKYAVAGLYLLWFLAAAVAA